MQLPPYCKEWWEQISIRYDFEKNRKLDRTLFGKVALSALLYGRQNIQN